MALFFLDTATLTLLQRGQPQVTAALAAHGGDVVAVSSAGLTRDNG
jgi:hypothetical protein